MRARGLYDKLVALLQLETLQDIEIAHYPLVQPDANVHEPFLLLEDRHLVVPHKPLLLAYTEACRVFAARLPDELLDATNVLLLQSPEHQSAVNARRRLLLAHHGGDIDRELRFVATLMSIPAASKSASLWHHRRWLIAWQLAKSPPRGPLKPASLARLDHQALEAELALAGRACENYPRNHSAWAHRAFLLASAKPEVLKTQLDAASIWLDRHIADHSAAQHLAALSRRCDRGAAQAQALDLIARYPDRETPWMLMRKVCTLEEGRVAITRHLEGDVERASGHALRAGLWYLHKAEQIQLDAKTAAGMRDMSAELTAFVLSRLQRWG